MRTVRCLAMLVALVGLTRTAVPQTFHRGGTEFHALRAVNLPAGKARPVMVVEFWHHGELAADGRNLLVLDPRHKPVPVRVLQVGPGDFCRLAFQPLSGQGEFEILYGGEPPAEGTVPPWTSKEGLLLETRQYRECNPNKFDSVREAFGAAKPLGSDYVETVQHGANPFALVPGPFLSRYTGTLHIDPAGKYSFFTSSQDASFLLIDGKLVVSAPGRHPPVHHAKPDLRKELSLTAGPHSFEYYHVATGAAATMMAAWVPPWVVAAKESKEKPTLIPADVFHADQIGRVRPGPPSSPGERLMPDFHAEPVGEVLLPQNDQALVGVEFANLSPPTLTTNSKTHWDFGDGQTGDQANPTHVYLRPGLYTVTLRISRSGKAFELSNRVLVERPQLMPREVGKQPTLDDYLPALQSYDPAQMDSASLRQLVLAYRFKTEQLGDPEAAKGKKDSESARRAEAQRYFRAAVEAVHTALTTSGTLKSDETLLQTARLVGSMAREQLGDASRAGQIWQAVARKLPNPEWQGECRLAAADLALNDLANPQGAKPLLDAATADLRKVRSGPLAARLQRVWGDYHALTGDGAAAQRAYREAESLVSSKRNQAQQIAWRGAHSRSTEEYLRDGELGRAAEELHAWEDQFPADKLDGALTLLYARYWAARDLPDPVVALSEQLLTVNRESPYADQLLLLVAEVEQKRKRTDRALATLHALVKDYPGSPLVPVAREKIGQCEASQKP